MRKALLIVVVLAIVVLVVGVLVPRLMRRPTDEPETAALGEASPYAGQERITGMGIVVPVRWARLSFATSSQLAEIRVTTGMTVTAGQVLATLERQELELQVQLAESELETQEAQLAQLKEGLRPRSQRRKSTMRRQWLPMRNSRLGQVQRKEPWRRPTCRVPREPYSWRKRPTML
jgi:multidrug efflux pump subunit AcrA (membrane-fusion protein)